MSRKVKQAEEPAEELLESVEAEASADEVPGIELPLGAQISAILLAAGKPVTALALARACKEKKKTVEEALQDLGSLYKEELHGFTLVQVDGAFQFRTSPGAAAAVREIMPPRARRLSRAAAETLAIVAYKQPIQRAEIEAIRGVDALPTLKTLLDARVIRIIGRDEDIGKPALYATTETFLERFGLNDITELPTIPELRELDAEPGEGPLNEEDSSTGEEFFDEGNSDQQAPQ